MEGRAAGVEAGRVAWLRVDPLFPRAAGQILIRDLPTASRLGTEERVLAEDALAVRLSGDRALVLTSEGYVVLSAETGEVTHRLERENSMYGGRIGGHTVAWYELAPGTEEDYEVYSMDLRSGAVTLRGAHSSIQRAPEVEGNQVVWLDDRHGHHTVHLLHFHELFTTDGEGIRRVTTQPDEMAKSSNFVLDRGRALLTEVREPWVAWAEPKPCAAVMYDIETGSRTELSNAFPCDEPTDLHGRWAVVEHDREGRSELVLIDTRTLERLQVTDYPRRSTSGRMEADQLVWADDRNDQWDLYTMDLSDLAAGDFFPEGVAP